MLPQMVSSKKENDPQPLGELPSDKYFPVEKADILCTFTPEGLDTLIAQLLKLKASNRL